MSSDSSDEDLDRTVDYDTFRRRYLGKTRKDGRSFNEGNIQYAYRFQHRNRSAASSSQEISERQRERRQKTREASREEGRQRTRGNRPPLREVENIQEEEAGGQRDQNEEGELSAADLWFAQQQQQTSPMETNANIRERRDVGDPSSGYAGSSAMGGSKPITYVGAPRNDSVTYTFEHVHLITTWGNAYKIFSFENRDKTLITKVMITSLACIPVQLLCFWMTYAEYNSLPAGSRVVAVECMVTPKGFKTSFDTGVTVTSSANNTQGVFAQVAVGLNRHILMRNYKVVRNATQPMKIDELKYPDGHDIEERLWGRHIYDDNFDASIPTCVGIQRTLPVYGGFCLPTKATEKNKDAVGWPEIIKFSKTFNLLDHMETPCVHYKYKVKTNVMKARPNMAIHDPAVTNKTSMDGEDIRTTIGLVSGDNKIKVSRISELPIVPETSSSYDDYVKELVEHCHSVTIPDHTPPNSGHPQPSLHVGVLPIQTNAPDKEIQEFVTSCATWELKTRIVVSTDFHHHYTYKNVNSVHKVPFGTKPFGIPNVFANSVYGFAPYE